MRRDSAPEAIAELATDDRTAIAVATHDEGVDETAIIAALDTPAGYIGVRRGQPLGPSNDPVEIG